MEIAEKMVEAYNEGYEKIGEDVKQVSTLTLFTNIRTFLDNIVVSTQKNEKGSVEGYADILRIMVCEIERRY